MKAAATLLVLTSLAVQTMAWKQMYCGKADWDTAECYDDQNRCTDSDGCFGIFAWRWCKCPNSTTRVGCYGTCASPNEGNTP